MKRKKKWLIAAIVLVVAVAVSVTVIAAGSYGTQSNPLVTLSYMASLRSKINADAKAAGTEASNAAQSALDAKIQTFTDDIEAQIEAALQSGNAAAFTEFSLSAGQTVTGGAGTEMILRSGSAVAAGGASSALTDTTTGESVAPGAALDANHLYLAGDGCGITAQSACTVLVRGPYSVA